MSEATDWAEQQERITRLTGDDVADRCIGIRWREVTIEALRQKKNDPTALDPYRCKNRGHWLLAPLTANPDYAETEAKPGPYCWSHLVQTIWDYGQEREYYIPDWRGSTTGEVPT